MGRHQVERAVAQRESWCLVVGTGWQLPARPRYIPFLTLGRPFSRFIPYALGSKKFRCCMPGNRLPGFPRVLQSYSLSLRGEEF